ncbi:hypothetical protein [Kitasatospora sp. LaBMicrA B282]|uniref:hypothetical protein n=1 Tax=Kitasatospora sp. LaBMicrA B282 TaxID=3420949 RepID=UPI003D0D1A58
MRTPRITTALLGVLALAACSSAPISGGAASAPTFDLPTPPPATSMPTSTAVAPGATPSGPTGAPSPVGWGPTVKYTSFTVTRQGGFKATVYLQWHAPVDVSMSQVFPDCQGIIGFNNNQATASSQLALRAVVIDVSTDFPAVNGFTWPAEQGLVLTMTSPAYACRNTSVTGSENPAVSTLIPGGASPELMYVYTAPKTPDSPQGTFDNSYQDAGVTLTGYQVTDCQATFGKSGIDGCSATYSGSGD